MDDLTGINSSPDKSAHLEIERTSSDLITDAHTERNDFPASSIDEKIITQALDFQSWLSETRLKGNHSLIGAAIAESSSTKARVFSKQPNSIHKFFKRIAGRITGQTTIEILHVVNLCQSNSKCFQWGWINPPVAGDKVLGTTFPISGWLLGEKAKPILIRLIVNEKLIAEVPVNIPRPDVVKAHFTNDLDCGFNAVFDATAFSGETCISLETIFSNQETALAGLVKFFKYG
jgi:hypothetical protein